ncbi:hypothetical protein C8Q79DRAFT_982611 [Trametes meyenii]|nr:hypothetical protein C8Q79DRAFT_982611 [Trametes meyenii]
MLLSAPQTALPACQMSKFFWARAAGSTIIISSRSGLHGWRISKRNQIVGTFGRLFHERYCRGGCRYFYKADIIPSTHLGFTQEVGPRLFCNTESCHYLVEDSMILLM